MTSPENKSSRSQNDTRVRLLNATIEMLNEGGESAVRVQKVAAMANITEPSVYHFFGSRSGLIEAAQIERFRRSQHEVTDVFGEAIRSCKSINEFREIVRASLLSIYNEGRAPYRAMRAEIFGSAQSRPELKALLRDAGRLVIENLKGHIDYAKERGWVRSDLDTYAFSTWMVGQAYARTVAELDLADEMSDRWNQIAIDAALAVLDPERA